MKTRLISAVGIGQKYDLFLSFCSWCFLEGEQLSPMTCLCLFFLWKYHSKSFSVTNSRAAKNWSNINNSFFQKSKRVLCWEEKTTMFLFTTVSFFQVRFYLCFVLSFFFSLLAWVQLSRVNLPLPLNTIIIDDLCSEFVSVHWYTSYSKVPPHTDRTFWSK